MKKAKEIYEELERFFKPQLYNDMLPNGLLEDNAEMIGKVYTATFISGEVIDYLRRIEASDIIR